MISVRARPAAGAATRSAVAAVEITAVSCAAHWLAGGMLPSAGWILASALLVFGVGLLLHRGQVSLTTALLGAASGQLFLHLALAQGMAGHVPAAGPVAAMGPSMAPSMAPSMTPSMALPMAIAHAVGAIATVVLWTVRRRAWDVLVSVCRLRPPVIPFVTALLIARLAEPDARLEWLERSRRGPPGWVHA